jgi:hypothetical protein
MFVALVIAAAVSPQAGLILQASPPPPIIAVALSPPQPIIRAQSRVGNGVLISDVTQVPAVPVRVRVTAGGKQLFNDTLKVNRNAGASYQESRNEAPEDVCPGQRYYGSQERYSLNVSLSLRDDTPSGPSVNVTVRWQRPSKLLTCNGEGSREVQLTQTVPLAPGQSVTVQGDAGLSVTVSR